ncbi:hypothetical protein G3N59_34340 [Paraburkholderia sp. Ac-20340]|uniref:hypothetical protein n=1 Tax=Paraburkholderia sp. Ac-20340 TaxID=2703888 RepID=UPI001980317A|nr:hypothetical protein [Paraburkholderia sp. Ac-20340]MBN3858480.1 hypothetical protein [Paraburkholderia sp. Ac-20340]
MQQMTFMECVKRAWASAWQTVTHMPAVVLGAFAIYAVLGWLALAGRPIPGEGDMPSTALILAGNIASLFNALVYLWFTLKVYRFVLLGERTAPLMPNGARPMLRMLGLGVLMMLFFIGTGAGLWLMLSPRTAASELFLALVVAAIWMIVGVRVCLLYPALAIGERFSLGAAWRDSQGHFWNLLGVSCVAALPLIVCAALVLIGMGHAGISPAVVQTPGWFTALAIMQSVANLAFALVTSSALAWLYRRYANALGPAAGSSAH